MPLVNPPESNKPAGKSSEPEVNFRGSWREQAITLTILPRPGYLCNGDFSTATLATPQLHADTPET